MPEDTTTVAIIEKRDGGDQLVCQATLSVAQAHEWVEALWQDETLAANCTFIIF